MGEGIEKNDQLYFDIGEEVLGPYQFSSSVSWILPLVIVMVQVPVNFLIIKHIMSLSGQIRIIDVLTLVDQVSFYIRGFFSERHKR